MSVETASRNLYAWCDARPEASHAYLDPVVLRAIKERPQIRQQLDSRVRVFDAGCGNGALLATLRGYDFEVAGCELSSAGVALARRSLGPDVRVEQLSVYEDLAAVFGTGWDVVVSTEVIEHLYAPRSFIDRVRPLLAPGGALILSTPYHGYLKNLALALTGALDRHFTALWDGGHIKFWSRATLSELLREAGFRDIWIYGAGRGPLLWKSMVVRAILPNATERTS